MGNWGWARRAGALVWEETAFGSATFGSAAFGLAVFGSEVGGCGTSDFPGSNYKVSDCEQEEPVRSNSC